MRVLRYLRLRGRLSQSTLSKKTGIPQPVISLYEHGLEIPDGHRALLWEALGPLGPQYTAESLDQPWSTRG